MPSDHAIAFKFGPGGDFIDFEVIMADVAPPPCRANFLLFERIDLSAGGGNRDWSPYAEPRFAEALESMLQLVDPGGNHNWSRKQCEAFFDDDAKFVKLVNEDVTGDWRSLSRVGDGASKLKAAKRRVGAAS